MPLKLPKCNSEFGAPMGRREIHLTPPERINFRFHLRKLPLDSGGYDEGGAYWGLRMPIDYTRKDGIKVRVTPSLYWFCVPTGKRVSSEPPTKFLIQGFIDAVSRQHAKEQILEQYPNATFYR